MSRVFAANTDHLDVASAPITDVPCAMSAWVKVTGFGNSANKDVFNIGQSASANNAARMRFNTSDTPFAMSVDNAGTTSSAIAASAISEGTRWYLLAANFASSSSREIFVNGTSSGTNATARAITPPFNAMRISGTLATTPTAPFVGLIAHVALWSAALSAADHANLLVYTPDKVQRGLLLRYWPLTGGQSPETEVVAGDSMTVTGTTLSNDNPLFPAIAGRVGSFIGVMP